MPKNIKVKRPSDNNPFHGMTRMLDLLHGKSVSPNITWKEAGEDKEKQLLHHILWFHVGDIQNRQHNIFGNVKVDDGGLANDTKFMDYLHWLLYTDEDLFIKLMPLVVEYTSLKLLNYYQIKLKNSVNRYGMLKAIKSKPKVYDALVKLNARFLISGTDFQRYLACTYLSKPTTNRKAKDGSRRKLSKAGAEKVVLYRNFLEDVSKEANLEVKYYPNNVKFKGLVAMRHQFRNRTEFMLFSYNADGFYTIDMDRPAFIKFLSEIPSGARYRVQRRLLDGEGKSREKWKGSDGTDLAVWFNEYMEMVASAQIEASELKQKEKDSGKKLTTVEKQKLKELEKTGSINTGATSFEDVFVQALISKDDTVIHELLRKMDNFVPFMVVADKSWSTSIRVHVKSTGVRVIDIISFMATVSLLKSVDTVHPLLIKFNTEAQAFSSGDPGELITPNRFVVREGKQVLNKIVDLTKPFSVNYNYVRSFMGSPSGGTYITAVTDLLKRWVKSDPEEFTMRKEMIQAYPAIVIFSDNHYNNRRNEVQSILEFKQTLLREFEWDGLIIVWDLIKGSEYFIDIDNVIYMSGLNLGTLTTVLNNLSDIDILDSYAPLKSIMGSRRYDPIKAVLS